MTSSSSPPYNQPAKSKCDEKKLSLTSRIKKSIFQEHIDSDPPAAPNQPTHPFLNVPPPQPPSPNQKTLSDRKFNISPRRQRHESDEAYRLRKARLELALKLQKDAPTSSLLARVHPKSGKLVVGQDGFAGTKGMCDQKNPEVKPKRTRLRMIFGRVAKGV